MSTLLSSSEGVRVEKNIRLEGVVWKRKPGFGKLSDTVGVGRSWERRHLVLHTSTEKDDDEGSKFRLCYYAIEDKGSMMPRGTMYLNPERVSISTTHLTEMIPMQPTPYSLSVKISDGTKWKLCFENRKSQMAWLVVLAGVLVDSTVSAYNMHTLSIQENKWNPSYRLYEEGKSDVFDVLKEVLIEHDSRSGATDDERIKKGRKLYVAQESLLPPTNLSHGDEDSVGHSEPLSPKSVSPDESKTTLLRLASLYLQDHVGDGYFLPGPKAYYVLTIVNAALLSVHFTSAYVSWWQVLVTINVAFMSLPRITSSTRKMKRDGLSPLIRTRPMQLEESSPSGAQLDVVKEYQQRMDLIKNQSQNIEPVSKEREDGMSTDDQHERWARSAPDVDLSGSWTLISDSVFKKEYDAYLKALGFNIIVRQLACSLIGQTHEKTEQSEEGRKLSLISNNPKGSWERVLISSGYPDFETLSNQKEGKDYSHTKSIIKTADEEPVEAEAWWEKQGTVHRSWLRGSTKYGGGDHESRRYLEDNGHILVCESTFHRRNNTKPSVRWRFKRDV